MADLLNNLIIVTKNNVPNRIQNFISIIPKLLMTLMDVPSPSNIRTVCNVLRIGVGPIIELENQNTEILRPLLDKLRQYVTHNAHRDQYAHHVLTLRDNGWRDYLPNEVPVQVPQRSYDIEGCELEPIYFNQAGVPYLAASTADPDAKELFY